MNTWQKNCYKNWQRIKYKSDWNSVYWFTLWILITMLFLGSYNDFAFIGYTLLLDFFISVDKEERIYG